MEKQEKKGFFSRLKEGLTKTRDNIVKSIDTLFYDASCIDEDFYEELEDILISSDVSVKTTMEIVDEIRDTAIKEKCKDKDYVVELLKKELLY